MELPTISALEFNQIRESIKNYIKTKTDFKDYDFEGSNLSMLVDVLAYNSMYSSYNINMAANELNLDTAVLRDNVVSHAKRLGYTPNSYTSAKISYNITVNNVSQYQSVNLTPGPIFSVTQNSKNYTFILREEITKDTQGNNSVTFENVEVQEGAEFSIRYTVDESNENQRFFVPNNYVDAESIKVYVISDPATNLEVEYQRKLSIVGVGAADRIFFVEEVQDQKYEVIFGDDVIGRKLQNGEIVIINYIVSSGSQSNSISASELKFVGSAIGYNLGAPSPIGTVNVVPTALATKTDGGSEFEPIKSIKYRAPRYYAAQQRAVVVSDYESILQNIYPNADLVRVVGGETKSPPEYGKVFISIKPKVGSTISTIEKRRIKNEIQPYTVGSITPVIEDAIAFYIDLYIKIIFDEAKSRKNTSTLISAVRQIVADYNLDDEFKNFNGVFSSSKIICLLRDIDPTVKFVVLKALFKRSVTLVENIFYRYKLNFYTKLKYNIQTKYTLISDPFCLKGFNEPVFLGAFGNDFSGCDQDNNIYLLTTRERVIGIVGTINYETGEVEFSITSCQDTPINIYVIPENADITTGADTYPTTELIDIEFIDVNATTPDDFDTTQPLPIPSTLAPSPAPSGDPFGSDPVTNVPGTTVTNPDGSITTVADDGTATTTNPDGSVTVEQPTDFIDECQKIYDKISAQGFTDNESEQRLIQLGCPPPDQNIEDFTPVIPDTCS
jgi:hypothetical protein